MRICRPRLSADKGKVINNFNVADHGFTKNSNLITFKTKFMFIFNMLGTWAM